MQSERVHRSSAFLRNKVNTAVRVYHLITALNNHASVPEMAHYTLLSGSNNFNAPLEESVKPLFRVVFIARPFSPDEHFQMSKFGHAAIEEGVN